MKRASLVLYLGILLVSLGLAYLTWVEEPKKPGGGLPVLRCKKGEILKLTYEAEDRTVAFSKKKSRYSGESAWWVEMADLAVPSTGKEADLVEEAGQEEISAGSSEDSTEQTGAEKNDLPAGDSPSVAQRIEVFKANQRLQDEMDKLCPWKALRSLGTLAGEKREEFGLTESAEFLRIEQASGLRTFRLGGETFGPKDRYVADDETGEVFLVAGQSLRDLLRPKSRFMERSLHAFKANEVARVKLRAGQREKELVQPVSEEAKEPGWADSRSPEETKDLYRNWIRKLFTLRPTDYVRPPDAEEREGCIAPAGSEQELRLTFYSPNKEIGFLTVYKEADDSGEPTYYACSEYTEIVVKVPKTQAETLLKDMEDLFEEGGR